MGDVVGPGRAAVGFARERCVLVTGLESPFAVETVGGEGAEVPALQTDGFDNHEVLVLALDGVDLYGLEEVLQSVLEDDFVFGAEAGGEIVEGHARAVDSAIVAGEEQVHVLVVADQGLVDDIGLGVRDAAREENLFRPPAVGVRGVIGGLVGEGVQCPLVG